VSSIQLRGFPTASSQNFAHGLPDDFGQITRQSFDRYFQAIDVVSHVINLPLDAIEARLDGCQIVRIAACLFEDMAGHELLAFDLALHYTNARLEFFPGHVGRHGWSLAPVRIASLTQVVSSSQNYSAATGSFPAANPNIRSALRPQIF